MGVVAYLIYHGMYGLLGVSKLYNLVSLLVAVGVEEVRDVVGKLRERLRG